MKLAYIFVAAASVVIGASFIASTASVVKEFYDVGWVPIVFGDSHYFLFFPVFGILMLAGFYLPSVVLVHLYWTRVRYGILRLIVGFVIVTFLSLVISKLLDTDPRAIWEVSPRALLSDRGEPEGCAHSTGVSCQRTPILFSLANLREAAKRGLNLSKSIRSCLVDPEKEDAGRCFATNRASSRGECCKAQTELKNLLSRMAADASTRSVTADLEKRLLFFKVFLIIAVLVVGTVLAIKRDALDEWYTELVPAMERGICVGALGLLFWVAMDYGKFEMVELLHGKFTGRILRYSFLILPWVVLMLFCFLRHLGKKRQIVAEIVTIMITGLAIFFIDGLWAWQPRLLGIGITQSGVAFQIIIVLVCFAIVLWPRRRNLGREVIK